MNDRSGNIPELFKSGHFLRIPVTGTMNHKCRCTLISPSPSPSPTPEPRESLGHHRWLHNQFPPFFSVLHCPRGLGELQTSPFPDAVSPPVCLVFVPLSLCLSRWFWSDLMTVTNPIKLNKAVATTKLPKNLTNKQITRTSIATLPVLSIWELTKLC